MSEANNPPMNIFNIFIPIDGFPQPVEPVTEFDFDRYFNYGLTRQVMTEFALKPEVVQRYLRTNEVRTNNPPLDPNNA